MTGRDIKSPRGRRGAEQMTQLVDIRFGVSAWASAGTMSFKFALLLHYNEGNNFVVAHKRQVTL